MGNVNRIDYLFSVMKTGKWILEMERGRVMEVVIKSFVFIHIEILSKMKQVNLRTFLNNIY